MKKIETEKEIVVFLETNSIAAMFADSFVNGKTSIGIFAVNLVNPENDYIWITISEDKNIIFYNTILNKDFKCKLKINKETNKDNRNRIIKKLNRLEENLVDTSATMKNKFNKLLK